MKNIVYLILTVAVLASCSSQPTPEEQAQGMLKDARELLSQRKYDAARDSIMALRHKYPTAVVARGEGILLLDSIELLGAQDSIQGTTGDEWKRLDVKRQFFERKLKVDKARKDKKQGSDDTPSIGVSEGGVG